MSRPNILRLSAGWKTDAPIVLVARTDALRLCREDGWEELPVAQALWHFARADRPTLAQLRPFVAASRLAGLSLQDVREQKLMEAVRTAIRTGCLSVLSRGTTRDAASGQTAELRRLIKKVTKPPRHRLSYHGRQYRLVVDVDINRLPDRDSYEVVPQADARRVLEAIALESGAPVDALAVAADKLSKDWRPPFSQPDGLVLMRRLPTQGSRPKDDGPALTPSQIKKLMKRPGKVRFLRGTQVCACRPTGARVVTEVGLPLPATVVGKLAAYGRRPLDGELITIEASDVESTTVTVTAGAASTQVELDPTSLRSEKQLLLWYGSSSELGSAKWDDIQLVDVSAGGSPPFRLELTATCDGAEAKLGLCDVLVKDAQASGGYRTARYGLFATKTPELKLVLPQIPQARTKVWLDDGDESTDDEIDVTSLVKPASGVTTWSNDREWVELGKDCTGKVNETVGRKRLFEECIETGPSAGNCCLFLHGENRLQVRVDDVPIFCAHALHYTDANETVPPGHTQIEMIGEGEDALPCIKDCLALDFKDGADDGAISTVLHALRLRPRAYAGFHKIVMGQSHASMTMEALQQLCDTIAGFAEPTLESLSLAPVSPVDAPNTGFLEHVPRAFHADFASPTFAHANLHWHHFVIHTFPALRAIESVLLPENRPPLVSLSGVQFDTRKTFIRPSGADAVQEMLELDQDDPERKMAIFGHTDRVGKDAANNALSLLRAQSLEALLKHQIGWWYDRYNKGSEIVGRSVRDQKWALKRLKHYTGTVDDNNDADYQTALGKLRTARALPEKASEQAVRTAMAEALREDIGAKKVALKDETAWGGLESQHMLKHLGHYQGKVNGNMGTAASIAAVKDLQKKHGLNDDGSMGICTRIVLIEDYMTELVPTKRKDNRFHANAVFGCGEAYPQVPTADEVENLQNRRVEVVFRKTPIEPIDPATQVGAACPYLQWLGPDYATDTPRELPNVVVAVTDTGLGGGAADDYRGEKADQPNRLFIKGNRLIRPTDVTGATAGNPKAHVVFANGHLTGVADPHGHGTAVMTCMAADGIGNPVGGAARTVNNFVLGTAPHVKIRPIRTDNNFWNNLLELEVMAADPDVLVYSTSCHLYDGWPAAITAKQRRAMQERLQDLVEQGKVVLASAGNYRSAAPIAGRYDTATRQIGAEAPDRRVPRSHAGYNGAEEHRRRISIVGSSAAVMVGGAIAAPGRRDTVAEHTYLGEQVGIHMPGETIRALSPAGVPLAGGMSNSTAANGVVVGGIGGTSFATPMTAGVVGELLMLDPALRQPANLVRALEYVEATADPLPDVDPTGGSGAPAHRRNADPGPAAGGPPNGAQAPTAASTYTHIRRVHYWKAVLAALNQGLSCEGRGANGATDPVFTYCTLHDDAHTHWYGLELRSPIRNAHVWFKRKGGKYVLARDQAALLPNHVTAATTWRTSDTYQLAANQPLPAYPWTVAQFTAAGRRPYYLCQLSIRKEALQKFDTIALFAADVDPQDPEGAEGPPILELELKDLAVWRNPTAALAAPDAWKQAIGTFTVFDDFVFHVTATPQPVASFRFYVENNRDGAGVGEELRVTLCALDKFGFLTEAPTPFAARVTHNGTPGSAGPNQGVFLNGAPAPVAGVVPVFGAGADPKGVARLKLRDYNTEDVTLSIDDGSGHKGSITIKVHPAGPIHGFALEIRRRAAGGASVIDSPARVREPIEVLVKAIDEHGALVASYTGNVTLAPTIGDVGRDGPPKRGVHVKNAEASKYDPKAFKHHYAAVDNGEHVFPLFVYTAGPLQLKATGDDEDITGESREISILGAAVQSFQVHASTPQMVGNAFDVTVTAVDQDENRIDDFEGTVTLGLVPGKGTAGTAPGGVKQGVLVGDTVDAGDDSYAFVAADGGTHVFRVAGYTAEIVRFRASHTPTGGGAVTGNSTDIEIKANAIDHFAFTVTGADRAGSPFDLEVAAMDAGNKVVTSFAGNVTLSLPKGTAYVAPAGGSPAKGVRIETAVGVAGNAHNYVAADAGRFKFRITPYTAETIAFEATQGATKSQSNDIVIESGPCHHFTVAVAAGARKNVPCNVTVTAADEHGNKVPRFLGSVSLRVRQGGGAWSAVGASHAFAAADAGVHVYAVTVGTSGAGHVIEASDGNIQSVSAAFNVAP